ncbi:MAG TPA: hypothetical protein ENJ53_04245 [Phaeodactylibacter sp.]|nr:hypothetical protein [Phaeodactylibacter sp.]
MFKLISEKMGKKEHRSDTVCSKNIHLPIRSIAPTPYQIKGTKLRSFSMFWKYSFLQTVSERCSFFPIFSEISFSKKIIA